MIENHVGTSGTRVLTFCLTISIMELSVEVAV